VAQRRTVRLDHAQEAKLALLEMREQYRDHGAGDGQ